MKKNTIGLLAILLSSQALAATAYFTGRQETVTTVTGRMATKCEYDYAGQKFTKVVDGLCPMSIEVQ